MECNGYTSINRNSQGNDLVSTAPAVPRSEVLKLVQLVFVVLMSAMQDDPANKMFFETNVSLSLFPPLPPFFFLLSLYLFYIGVSSSFSASPSFIHSWLYSCCACDLLAVCYTHLN